MGRGPGFPEGSRCPQVVESRLPLSSPMEVPGGGRPSRGFSSPFSESHLGRLDIPTGNKYQGDPGGGTVVEGGAKEAGGAFAKGSQGWVLPGHFPQLVGAADGLGLNLSGS